MGNNVNRRELFRGAAAGLAGVAALPWMIHHPADAQDASAASWPDRPITSIVPVAAGGIIDILSRAVGDAIKTSLGATVITESRPGADHLIGIRAAAHSAPDGYTWLFGSVPFTVNPSLRTDAGYDPVADFTPLQLIASSPNVLVVPSSIPAKTVSEFVALAKAKPGVFNYANPGNGSSNHLCMELFKQISETDIVSIVYKGQPPAITDLISGRVEAMMISSSLVGPHVASGALRALASISPERVSSLPEVPTMAEAGFKEVDVVPWFGLFAPAKTPSAIVQKASGALHEALKSEDLITKINRIGATAYPPNSPEKFAELIKADLKRWPDLIKRAGIKPT